MNKQDKIEFIKNLVESKADSEGYAQVNKSPSVDRFFIDGAQLHHKRKLKIWVSNKDTSDITNFDERDELYGTILNSLYEYAEKEKEDAFCPTIAF